MRAGAAAAEPGLQDEPGAFACRHLESHDALIGAAEELDVEIAVHKALSVEKEQAVESAQNGAVRDSWQRAEGLCCAAAPEEQSRVRDEQGAGAQQRRLGLGARRAGMKMTERRDDTAPRAVSIAPRAAGPLEVCRE